MGIYSLIMSQKIYNNEKLRQNNSSHKRYEMVTALREEGRSIVGDELVMSGTSLFAKSLITIQVRHYKTESNNQ